MASKAAPRFKGTTRIYVTAGLLALAAALAGYAWKLWTVRAPPAGPPEQVTLAVNMEYVGSCPIIAARANGYFANEGISALIQPYTSGKEALQATLKGRADLATVADIPIVFAAMNRVPLSIVATIFRTEKDHGIVGRRDRGIGSPASLKGKRVGVTIGSSGHFVLDAILNRQGLALSEVTMLNLKPEEFSAALAKGDVDAVATWEPSLDNLLTQLGSNGASFYGENVYEIPFNIAGTRAYVASHPETMKKILRALIQGALFCEASPDTARALLAANTKLDTSRLKVLWPAYRFDVTLDQGLLLALEDETRWAIKHKLADSIDMPNYLDYVSLDALEAVAPVAVTVIH